MRFGFPGFKSLAASRSLSSNYKEDPIHKKVRTIRQKKRPIANPSSRLLATPIEQPRPLWYKSKFQGGNRRRGNRATFKLRSS